MDRIDRSFLWLCGAVLLLCGVLLVYSQTEAAAWDEGFHLLAAQLINAGKRPYLDFLFPQTPLIAYWNAVWMRWFGESWRVVHAVSATLTAGALLLAGDYVRTRLPVPAWRLPAALATALLIALNTATFEFGAIAQAYGLCLFLIVAAFRLSILAVERRGPLWGALAGAMAGAAAASSLLTAPVAPVLLLWVAIRNRVGNRWAKSAAFVAGAIVPFLPLLRLYLLAPRQVLFNVVEYHLFYRQLDWEGALRHDLGVLGAWINSASALLLVLLAFAGLLFVRRSGWDRDRKAQYYLCGWLVLALCLHLCSAHPTFARYYLFTTPFLAILAAAGLYDVGSRLDAPDRPWRSLLVLAILLCLGLADALYQEQDVMTWRDFEQVARKVEEVTPPGNSLLADEFVYFLTRRTPPSGMELEDSHKLTNLSPEQAAALHVLPRPQLNQQVEAGKFQTVETCDDDDERILALHLPQRYSHRAEVSGCVVYWGWIGSARRGS